MLKDSEELIKRRKLSFTYATERTLTSASATSARRTSVSASASATATTAMTTTPPITPPTPPPLSTSNSTLLPAKMLVAATTASLNALTTTLSANDTALSTPQHPAAHSLTPTTMAASLLANAAAAAAAAVAAANNNNNSNTSNGGPSCVPVGSSQVQDHYSLRWNNHQNHILRAFDALLQTKALVDVTLVCAETSISAHKIVLSACSPFFQRVFAENPCKHPVIVLKDFRGWVVQAIVDFMYRGEISVPQERLQTLIQAGESLQVRGLVESSVPEHTPTPAASPDDFGMIDSSLLSSELERCSSFDEESPSMVTAGSKVILPSRLFGSSTRRERNERKRDRERERERERDRGREIERNELESDQEMPHDSSLHSDICTSPMPRRKQARPRRRSGELPHELIPSKSATPTPINDTQPLALDKESTALNLEALKTVIKTEILETSNAGDKPSDPDFGETTMGDCNDQGEYERDSGNGNDSHENNEPNETPRFSSSERKQHCASSNDMILENPEELLESQDLRDNDGVDDFDEANAHRDEHENSIEQEDEPEDIEELIQSSNELHRKSLAALSNCDGPEDLCTTRKDNDTSGHHTASSSSEDNETNSPTNNNNSKLSNNNTNNNNRIVLSLKDIRHLNKPTTSSSSTPNGACNNPMNPFATTSLRDLRLDRSNNCNTLENQCKMDALEAQMHAAAAAAAAAAASGENPFQHMEHQMDLSLAAAAAAAAVSHQHSRERDQALQREQQQHNAYANSLLGQMGMPGMPGPFGPGSGGPGSGPNGTGGNGQALHERLEESMNRLTKEFAPSSPMSLPTHFNPPDGPPHPPSPLPFPGMSSALALTPPHMFGLDSPLGLFPPGIDPGKLYNPLMEMSDPRGMPGDPPPFLKKKMPRPKGQHSAPRGGPPRSWTNAELTEALQHVWNKKMTTSQASRIFGIPYNSLLMYVRGKYGKSLKLEQLRKDCISGPPIELLQMGINNSGGHTGKSSKNSSKESRDGESRNEQRGGSVDMDLGMLGGPGGPNGGPRSASSEPDLLGGPNSLFNPFPPGFYPDFPGGFPGLPLSMLNLLPPTDRHQHGGASMHHHMSMDEDCKSDRSKHSSMDEEYGGLSQPLALNREHEHRRSADLLTANSGSGNGANTNSNNVAAAAAVAVSSGMQQNGGMQD